MLAGPHGMKDARFLSLIRSNDLCTCHYQNKHEARSWSTYVRRVCITHDDVQYRDVAAVLVWLCGHHLVLRL
jgi:hypothetical protein